MTALAGFWAFGGRSDPLAASERMLRAQQVYAPDPPLTWSGGEVALGRRLFKLLPEDRHDHGPVTGGGGRWALVADARLDNREELCDALGISAGEAAGLADSALLVKALERWEDEAVERLVGAFAFAAWDRDRRRLLLARDFMGARPLHYHRSARFFAFSTMAKGLHALPEVPTGPDEESVARFLALVPEEGSSSFFAGIERVPPGHLAAVTAEGVLLRRYWDPAPRTLRLKRAEDYADALRESFDRAVTAQLRGGGGHVGAHLSGGLDSSAVAATAARRLAPDGRVTAFTSVPREGYCGKVSRGRFADEGPHAAAVAALYPNMEHVRVRTAGKSPFAGLDRNFFLYERPYLNLCNGVWAEAIGDEAKRRGLNVLLTGQMGNMSFSYTGLERLPQLLAEGRLLRLAREAALLHRRGITLESVAAHAVGPYLPAGLWRAINRLRGRRLSITDYSAMDPGRAAALRSVAAEAGLDMSYRPRRDPHALRLWAIRRIDAGNYQKGALGGWGIDMRDPTADQRLVELCLSIPAEQYLCDGWTRALARRAFADRLPEIVVRETRKGYQAADWNEGLEAAREEARDEVEQIAALPAAEGLFDTRGMRALFDEWPAGDWNSHAVQAKYRLALLRGISAGHFLRKALGSN